MIAEIEFTALLLGAFLRTVRFAVIERLWHDVMVLLCDGFGALVLFSKVSIDRWFLVGVLSLIREMKINSVLGLGAVALVAKNSCRVSP